MEELNIISSDMDVKKKNKHIGFTISEELSEKWKDFAKKNDITTLSKLIRKAVNFYIDFQPQIEFSNDVPNILINLKNPLTAIKGFSQLLLENYKKKLDFDVLIKIKSIYDQSLILEHYINDSIPTKTVENPQFDIFIVDDDEATVKLLSDFFENKNYSVKYCSKGLEAAKLLEKFEPKIILLDMLLQDIDGYKICDMIKKDDLLKKIPVYYITALNKAEVEKKVQETQANGYFLKPFNLNDFDKLFDLLKS